MMTKNFASKNYLALETKNPLQAQFELIVCNKGLLVPKKLISKLTNNNNASMPTLAKTCDCGASHSVSPVYRRCV